MNTRKREYDINFIRSKCKQYTLLLSKENDSDIISYLESVPNRNGFLKALIREQIKKGED